ncbi:hypothetical protein KOW79_020076 [Hemibagrus wyckioides]|uniref:Serpin B6 n=1 Tax=Hemibagrus wyckioides TaxID=337641 RepID=A0A9D3SAK2_9TELE|nr:leukocyte elastase inhibitor-like isoform X2 [Hemibagrus wyckioides]KAG7316535.1 hypothetical protein KOW79_020076 [Hemibagrus wyckioides]
MESLSMANTNFALHLFSKIKEGNKTNNIFYSPLSISSALSMVLLGAAGNTATQISEVLCFDKAGKPVAVQQAQQTQKSQTLHQSKAKDDIHVSFNKLLSELNKAGAPYTLSLANRLYGEQSYQFMEKFLNETKTHYKAKLETVDFKSNAEASRVKINNWVEKQTKEKIKNLLAKGTVDNLTKLVLVNAIYLKCNWEKQFDQYSTKEHPFKMNKTETKLVQMMNQTAMFPLALIPEIKCKILEMPYEGQELSMLIMLPFEIEDDTTGLEKIEKHLTYEKFIEWTDGMKVAGVQVSLPRFKLEDTYDMKELLIGMGMVDAFNPVKSDFSRMSPCKDLVVSKVVHKSFVGVNEEGTEAAAATGVVITSKSAIIAFQEFVADHPFLFFIQHKSTRSILFSGRYSSP